MEVCVGGVWGSVCRDTYWDNADASVICGQLGFSKYGMYKQGCHITFTPGLIMSWLLRQQWAFNTFALIEILYTVGPA